MARRAAKENGHKWTIFPIISTLTTKERRKSVRSSIGYWYMRYRDNIRVGHKQFDVGEKKEIAQEIVWLVAHFAKLFIPNYRAAHQFTSVDAKDFLDSREYWPHEDDIEGERGFYKALLKREI